MLDYGFEQEGFCVVRGPDLLWGSDIRSFNPPRYDFDGIMGGPPCQAFSPIGNVNRARYGESSVMPDQIPEFTRLVKSCKPTWWLMENSPHAYAPIDPCFSFDLDLAWFGLPQSRKRRFWSNLDLVRFISPELPTLLPVDAGSERTVSSKESVDWKGSRASSPSRSIEDMLELQGLPKDWLDHQPWTMAAKKKMVGNGVPIPIARALAKAVKSATAGVKFDE